MAYKFITKIDTINLIFSKLAFNKDTMLSEMAFSVDCNDGFSGSASTTNLKDGMKFGFYRIHSNPEFSFGTGNISELFEE